MVLDSRPVRRGATVVAPPVKCRMEGVTSLVGDDVGLSEGKRLDALLVAGRGGDQGVGR